MSAIPEHSRAVVRNRAKHRCERCAVPAPNGHWHHRRGRSVRDQHQHCACNGVWLCSTCHRWVHEHPTLARDEGFLMSRHVTEPGAIPLQTPWGTRVHGCDGTYLFRLQSTEVENSGYPPNTTDDAIARLGVKRIGRGIRNVRLPD